LTLNGLPVAHPSPEEFERMDAETASPRGTKHPAEEVEGEAAPSSRVRTMSPLREEEQFPGVPLIPQLDGASDARSAASPGSSTAGQAFAEMDQLVSPEPLRELLEMGEGLFRSFAKMKDREETDEVKKEEVHKVKTKYGGDRAESRRV
jgi:hypothetical protein